MSRLAWFTPWPAQRSGVAGRSAELTAHLAARGHAIDVFVDEQDATVTPAIRRYPDHGPNSGAVRVQSAHDFVWRAHRGQYDLSVYQLGNSRLHEFIWPYLFQWPGLVVLHDARLHHARGRALLRRGRDDEYRAEFAWNHPDINRDAAEVAVEGFSGPYYYQWPMMRAVVESARLVACHSRGGARELQQQFPERPIEYVALGEGPTSADLSAAACRFRAAHGIASTTVVFGVHGALTAEKRVPQVLRAFAAMRPWLGDACLLLAGHPDPGLRLGDEIDALGIREATRIVPALSDEEFDVAIAASDVSINLRWPTALETSGPWLRSLALSRPTIIIDFAHQGDLPVLDPRTWKRHAPTDDLSDEADAHAMAVAIDVLDEEHSLRLAIKRLAVDRDLRDALGRNGHLYWEREHTVPRMVDEMERLIARAMAQPIPSPVLPPHLRPNPEALADALVMDLLN